MFLVVEEGLNPRNQVKFPVNSFLLFMRYWKVKSQHLLHEVNLKQAGVISSPQIDEDYCRACKVYVMPSHEKNMAFCRS